MADPYTPDRRMLRTAYIGAMAAEGLSTVKEARDEFDRGIARHDTEVRLTLLSDLLEQHLVDVQYPNGYAIRAVPQAVLIDLIASERKGRP